MGSRFSVAMLATKMMAVFALSFALALQIELAVRTFAGEVYRHSGVLVGKEGDLRYSRWLFDKASSWNPHDYRTQKSLGDACRAMEDYPNAVKSLSASVRLAPNDVLALLDLAIASALSGDHAAARDVLQRARDLVPGYWRVYETGGIVEGLAGNHAAAMSEFEKALSFKDVNRASILKQLAIACVNLKNLTKAIEYASEAVQLEPDVAQAHLLQARIFFALNRTQDAIRAGSKCLDLLRDPSQLKPNDRTTLADAHAVLCEAYLSEGRFVESSQSLLTAAQLNSSSSEAKKTALKLLELTRDNASLAADDRFGLCLLNLGAALANLGELELACGVLARAMPALSPQGQTACGLIRGRALAQLGRLQEAEDVLRLTRNANANVPDLRFALAQVLAKNGKTEEARAECQSILSTFSLNDGERQRIQKTIDDLPR